MPPIGGFTFAEDPKLPAPAARLIWAYQVNRAVVRVEAMAASPAGPDSFDLAHFAGMVSIAMTQNGEVVALSDGYQRIRLDVVSGSLLDGPVRLHYHLSGFCDLDVKLLTLRRLAALCRRGRFSSTLHPREPRAPRWIAALRAHDAIAEGASQREIAATLFGEAWVSEDWRRDSDSLRLRTQRLVRSARTMVAGGYLRLLR
jgi:hypothetical protein